MGNRFVTVNITRKTQAVSQQGFGIPLVLSNTKEMPYKEYAGDTALADIGKDFGVDSETYKLAAAVLGQETKVDTIAVLGMVYDAETGQTSQLTDKLNEIILTNNDFYYLVSTLQSDTAISALAEWAAANAKIYGASTNNKTLATTLNNERVFVLVHEAPGKYPCEAWIGAVAAKPIGSYTWTFKKLSGIDPVKYGSGEVTAIHKANGNTYIREGGVNITSNGVMTNGEYIDIIQGTDFISSRMTENVFGVLVREDKVPFTTAGIAMIVDAMEQALQLAFSQGIIAPKENGKPDFTITVPSIEDISDSDKAARRLPSVPWTATVAGAIEDVGINGTLEI